MNRDRFLRSATPSGDPNSNNNTNNNSSNDDHNPLLGSSEGMVSDLEQEVLDEYSRLLENVNRLSNALATLADSPASLTLDGLRHLERKTATVYTLLKASVYSIVLQQQIINDDEVAAAAAAEQQHQQNPGVYGDDEASVVMGGHGLHGG